MADDAVLGIVTGLQSEAAILQKRLTPSHRTIVACHGMGPARATSAADALVRDGATALMSFGIAGGLSGEVRAGDTVVPRRVIGDGGAELTCDARWCEALARMSSSVRRRDGGYGDDTLLSASVIIDTAAAKQQLHADTGAVAVDMESFAVGAVAQKHALPFAVLRVIADPHDRLIPAALFAGIDADGKVKPGEIAKAVLRQPSLLPHVIAIARQSAVAHQVLKQLADAHLFARFGLDL